MPGKQAIRIPYVEMWPGGPLRQFSDRRLINGWVAYSSPLRAGYAGPYVCGRCLMPASGIYRSESPETWLCGRCAGVKISTTSVVER